MNTNQIARIAALVGEPARTAMLLELMGGRALTAHELARAGNVSPPTASKHLAQMVEAGLLELERQGRHRYHRLASPEVAKLLEGIMQLAAQTAQPVRRALVPGPKDAAMRRARTCYDHIAGRLGVAISDRLVEAGAVVFEGESGHVTEHAAAALAPLDIPWDNGLPAPARRAFCRPCLDWSERRPHLAGRLGALICSHGLAQGWLRRGNPARTLEITPQGAVVLRGWLGQQRWDAVTGGAPS